MIELINRGTTQTELLHCLLRNKEGQTIDALAKALAISRNAVRQHLTSLERDGLVSKGAALPSRGRPQQTYVLNAKGREQFPRQYSWFADMLVSEALHREGTEALQDKLATLGRQAASRIEAGLAGEPASPERVQAVSAAMSGLGYDSRSNGKNEIEAFNCVFHDIAARHPSVCSFDLGLIAKASGGKVEHAECMVRGGKSCRFIINATGRKKG